MKTLTEFSGIIIKRAADIRLKILREARSLGTDPKVGEHEVDSSGAETETPPKSETAAEAETAPAAETTPATETAAGAEPPPKTETGGGAETAAGAETAPEAETAAGAETAAEAEPPPEAETAAETEPPPEAETAPETEPPPEAEPAAADADGQVAAAIEAELGIAGDRLARLLDALQVIGKGAHHVRLVRVYQGEKGPSGSKAMGEFHYAVDRLPRPSSGKGPGRSKNKRRGDRSSTGGDKRRGKSSSRGPRDNDSKKRPARGGNKPRGDRSQGARPRGRGDIPVAGAGWMLSREPSPPREEKPSRRGDKRDPRNKKKKRRGGTRGAGRRGDSPTKTSVTKPSTAKDERTTTAPTVHSPRGSVAPDGPRQATRSEATSTTAQVPAPADQTRVENAGVENSEAVKK